MPRVSEASQIRKNVEKYGNISIAMLLIKYLQFKSKLGWSLSNLVALLHWNLFTYRDLWKWIDDPFKTPPIEPQPEQLTLNIKGLGQHRVAKR